ncbi:hypothetical protein LGN04_17565 [Burkholderia multivorans]|nr:hypothetical protein [Burkholderia multivorans]MCA8455736.1 hypothetical protein [Burkholderia multivorans]MCA8486386.1 hypothetical protein [Burkholderia multivorans]MDN7870609.1 hypothetical protein [Burkholderia multivorans]
MIDGDARASVHALRFASRAGRRTRVRTHLADRRASNWPNGRLFSSTITFQNLSNGGSGDRRRLHAAHFPACKSTFHRASCA